MKGEAPVGLHVKCPILFSDFNQIVVKPPEYQISSNPFSGFSGRHADREILRTQC
jgi:hypothetical protein